MSSQSQLYEFAHRTLPQILFSAPAQFFMVLSSDKAPRFLADVWEMCAEHCRNNNQPADLVVDQWIAHTVKLGSFPCVIVEMPPPQQVTEAYFVAAVLMLDIAADLPNPDQLSLRYFTLERNDLSSTQTMLCGWNYAKQGPTHSNYGEGSKPGDLKGFAQAVENLLRPA